MRGKLTQGTTRLAHSPTAAPSARTSPLFAIARERSAGRSSECGITAQATGGRHAAARRARHRAPAPGAPRAAAHDAARHPADPHEANCPSCTQQQPRHRIAGGRQEHVAAGLCAVQQALARPFGAALRLVPSPGDLRGRNAQDTRRQPGSVRTLTASGLKCSARAKPRTDSAAGAHAVAVQHMPGRTLCVAGWSPPRGAGRRSRRGSGTATAAGRRGARCPGARRTCRTTRACCVPRPREAHLAYAAPPRPGRPCPRTRALRAAAVERAYTTTQAHSSGNAHPVPLSKRASPGKSAAPQHAQ